MSSFPCNTTRLQGLNYLSIIYGAMGKSQSHHSTLCLLSIVTVYISNADLIKKLSLLALSPKFCLIALNFVGMAIDISIANQFIITIVTGTTNLLFNHIKKHSYMTHICNWGGFFIKNPHYYRCQIKYCQKHK